MKQERLKRFFNSTGWDLSSFLAPATLCTNGISRSTASWMSKASVREQFEAAARAVATSFRNAGSRPNGPMRKRIEAGLLPVDGIFARTVVCQ